MGCWRSRSHQPLFPRRTHSVRCQWPVSSAWLCHRRSKCTWNADWFDFLHHFLERGIVLGFIFTMILSLLQNWVTCIWKLFLTKNCGAGSSSMLLSLGMHGFSSRRESERPELSSPGIWVCPLATTGSVWTHLTFTTEGLTYGLVINKCSPRPQTPAFECLIPTWCFCSGTQGLAWRSGGWTLIFPILLLVAASLLPGLPRCDVYQTYSPTIRRL